MNQIQKVLTNYTKHGEGSKATYEKYTDHQINDLTDLNMSSNPPTGMLLIGKSFRMD